MLSTDAMYNASSRYLHKMYRIHFSGAKVLEVLRSDYLLSSSILEESYGVSSSPFGDVTSNELELSLLNSDGIFNPKNTESPYYGFIRRGIKIEAFVRPDEVDEWDPAGVFYVTDWSTSSSGMSAEVLANDKLYSIVNAPVPSMPIVRDIPFAYFIRQYFSLFDAEVTVDDSIDLVLPYGFTSGYSDNRALLTDLMTAAIADCYCDHSGNVTVRSKVAARDTRATFTDDDQIVTVSIKQSLATDYDSASVSYNSMQESAEQEVLSISEIAVSPGTNTTALTKFSSSLVTSVKSIRAESTSVVKPIGYTATADSIICSLNSNGSAAARLTVIGTVLEKVSSVVSTPGSSAVELDSSFVQTLENANRVLKYTDRFVNAEQPSLDLVIRGNPRLQLGDKIEVDSTKYKTQFVGTLTKAKYIYDGGLSCEVTLTDFMTEEE